MKNINIEISVLYCSMDELDDKDRLLIKRAMDATDNSYAKYSNFHVGAAVLLDDGSIFIGANQENAAYPSGLCAERTAVFSAQANCPDVPVNALAIAARNKEGFLSEPITPCGACRQVILEIEERYRKPVRILLYGTKGVYIVSSVKELLPLSFVDGSMHQ